MSIPPIGGIIFRKGSSKTSETDAIVLKGSLYQFIDGIHVRKILAMIIQKYISNNKSTISAIEVIFSP